MSNHVIETVTFRLIDGIPHAQFLDAARQATAFMIACPGFVRRRLSCAADGTWIEHVEWASMESATAAAAEIGKDDNARAFVRAIDGPSVTITHSDLKVSAG